MSDAPAADALNSSDRERIELLVNKMFEAPAITCGIRYVWRGNQDLADKASIFVRLNAQALKEAHPWICLDDLKDVYFYTDYEQGLRDAVAPEETAPVPTKEVGGLSVGMHVKTASGSKLVMQEGVAHALLSDDADHQDFAVSVLRHEFCHVHDEAFKSALADRDGIKHARDEMEGRFLPMSQALWSEYFANKYSHGPWANVEADFDLLRGAVDSVRCDVRSAIIKYRTSGNNLDGLLAVAEPKVRFLMQCFGYAAGRLAGLGLSLEEHDPKLADLLKRQKLFDCWMLATSTLDRLDALRPDWPSFWLLCDLNAVGVSAMSSMGLHYRPHGEGIYVDVPYTADTMPGLSTAATTLQQMIQGLNLSFAQRMRAVVEETLSRQSTTSDANKE